MRKSKVRKRNGLVSVPEALARVLPARASRSMR